MNATNVTPEMIQRLTTEIEGIVELRVGHRLAFVCLIHDGDCGLGLFTNRRDDSEVILMLDAALSALKERFIAELGELPKAAE